MRVSQSAVMKPYGVRKPMALGWRIVLVSALILVATLYGMLSAVLPMSLIIMPMVPILLIAAFCLWLMPDIGGMYEETYAKLTIWCIVLHILWPPYIALNLPGLPWISPQRLVSGALVLTFLFNLASSAEMRAHARASMMAEPAIGRLFWAYWALTAVTIVLSSSISSTLTTFANNQIVWTMFFVLATMVSRKPGFVAKALTFAFIATLPSGFASILEYRAEKVIWVEYLPSWLLGDEELVSQLLVSVARTGYEVYRARGTTLNPLYYAEYLALIFPIGLHLLWTCRSAVRQVAIVLAMMLLCVAMWLTGSRTAVAGIVLSIAIFVFLTALRKRTENPQSIAAAATLFAYPAMLVALVGVVLSWRRAYVAIIGGGQHEPSNLAREVQWKMGWEILKRNPIGHGTGQSGEVLGYTNPAGTMTIDSYYLVVLLDHGVLALPIFVAMFSIPIYYALRYALRRYSDPELAWLIPIGVGLANLMIIKTVNAGSWNMPVAFLMLGFAVGLIWRMQTVGSVAEPGRALAPQQPAGAM